MSSPGVEPCITQVGSGNTSWQMHVREALVRLLLGDVYGRSGLSMGHAVGPYVGGGFAFTKLHIYMYPHAVCTDTCCVIIIVVAIDKAIALRSYLLHLGYH